MNEARPKTPKAPTSEAELRREQGKIYRSSAAALVLCAVVLLSAHFLLPRIVGFPEPTLEARLTFWAAANLLLSGWVMAGIGMVSRGRRHSPKDIQGSAYDPPSEKIAVAAAFLQNTLEPVRCDFSHTAGVIMLWGEPAMPFHRGDAHSLHDWPAHLLPRLPQGGRRAGIRNGRHDDPNPDRLCYRDWRVGQLRNVHGSRS